MNSQVNIVIIGGVAGGMSAATRARRTNEHANITVIERGGFISFANCGLPYYIAGQIKTEDKLLVTTAAKVNERFNINVRTKTEAIAIDRAAKTVTVRDLASGNTETVRYDKLILAPGADPFVPPIEHVRSSNVFTLRSIEDTRAIQDFVTKQKPQRVVIAGAGFIGLEMAEALHQRGAHVTVLEKNGWALPPLDREMALDIHRELAAKGVTLITGKGLASLEAANGRVTTAVLEDGQRVPADMLLMSIGVRPNVALAKAAGLTIGVTGGIAVDQYQRTNDPDIYAVGDAAEITHGVTGKTGRIPLAGPANRQGRIAGQHAASGESTATPRVFGTAIVRVFDLAAGLTGLSENAARNAGYDIDTAYVSGNHHAGYYPGAQPLKIKLVYDRPTGKVLGAQITGRDGVDKRLDVIATLLHFGGTIDDLAALDFAYAPQFGSAKDPLHMAAFVAQNQRSGMTPGIVVKEVNGRQLVDVRTDAETAKGILDNAITIPLDSLRQRIGELDASRATAVYCQAGLRGHIATRILKQNGFKDVVNVKGGYGLAVDMR